jgi:hypothetical protein
MNLGARAYDRILKVVRTIADLLGAETLGPDRKPSPVWGRTRGTHCGGSTRRKMYLLSPKLSRKAGLEHGLESATVFAIRKARKRWCKTIKRRLFLPGNLAPSKTAGEMESTIQLLKHKLMTDTS